MLERKLYKVCMNIQHPIMEINMVLPTTTVDLQLQWTYNYAGPTTTVHLQLQWTYCTTTVDFTEMLKKKNVG